jgi:hypothetical protein
MDHKKFGAFSNLGTSSYCLNNLKAGPALDGFNSNGPNGDDEGDVGGVGDTNGWRG